MTTDPYPWATRLDTLFAQVWVRLQFGVDDRDAPARHLTLANISTGGWPQARTVGLRGADPWAGTLDIHTDRHSVKIAALRALPRVALLVWDAPVQLQTRIEATVTVLTGDAVAGYWDRVPEASRPDYGTTPAPGLPIADALAYDKTPDPAAFAVLRCAVQAVDAVHLGPQHRRARFERADGWAGQWLSP